MSDVLVPAAVVVVVVLLLAPYLRAKITARKQVGATAPDLSAYPDFDHHGDGALYFFHAEHCPHCRRMQPAVDELARSHGGVFSVDVAQYPEMASAFRVAGTPTVVTVNHGEVTAYLLGERSAGDLAARLTA